MIIKGLLFRVSMLVILALAGGSGLAQESRPTNISIGVTDPGSTWFALGSGISQVLKKTMGLNATVEVTTGAADIVRLLQAGELDFGFSASVIPFEAYTGRGGVPVHDDIRTVFAYASSYIKLLTRANSGITSPEDLKGKRVSIGPPGSSTLRESLLVLEAYGLSERDIRGQRLTISEATAALRDGTVDAAFINLSIPAAAIEEVAYSIPMRIVELDDEHRDKIIDDYPSFYKTVIPGGTYPGIDEDVPTLGVQMVFLTRVDMDEDFVYSIVESLFEQQADLERAHPTGRFVTLENASRNRAVPLHPGAERYYQEQGALD